jgi:putative addiction module component (TIGR02574 family)
MQHPKGLAGSQRSWYNAYIMSTLARADVLSLSVSERIQLVEDIWDTIAEVPEQVGLSDEQKAELDRRLDAYHQNPDEGSPWGMVRERIRRGR